MKTEKTRSARSLYKFAFALLFSAVLSGCANTDLRVAEDLLVNTDTLAEPRVANGYLIAARINPKINNTERIDKSVEESLKIALDKANVFGDDGANPYKIHANIEIASQAAVSFGNFEGKLQIAYAVFDADNNKVAEKTIYTEAGSDQWHFAGVERHARARSVNISKNVLEFVEYLKSAL